MKNLLDVSGLEGSTSTILIYETPDYCRGQSGIAVWHGRKTDDGRGTYAEFIDVALPQVTLRVGAHGLRAELEALRATRSGMDPAALQAALMSLRSAAWSVVASRIQPQHVLSAARSRGVFAVPTRAGAVGPVLLGSLGLVDVATRVKLLDMYNAGEISLRPLSGSEIGAQSGRLADMRLVVESRLFNHSGNVVFHAILVEAVAMTGDELTEAEVASERQLDETASKTRERVAAGINQRRRVLPALNAELM